MTTATVLWPLYMYTIINFLCNNPVLTSINTFSLIGLYSVGIVYQPRQTTLHLWDVSEECYRELI